MGEIRFGILRGGKIIAMFQDFDQMRKVWPKYMEAKDLLDPCCDGLIKMVRFNTVKHRRINDLLLHDYEIIMQH